MGRSKHRDGQYVPLPYAMIRSAAWRDLSGNAVRLWLELHARFNGSNNGRLILSFAEASEVLGVGKATVRRSYQDLVDHGFLALEKPGNWYNRRAHEWRLTTKPIDRAKDRDAATNEWRYWQPPKTERGSETEPSEVSVVPFENPKPPNGSKPEPVSAVSRRAIGSETEH